jgi:hypothetical protein
MRKCSHYVALEEKCPQCVAEGLAREAARKQAPIKASPDQVNDGAKAAKPQVLGTLCPHPA